MLWAGERVHASWPLTRVFSAVAYYLQNEATAEYAEKAFLADLNRMVRRRA